MAPLTFLKLGHLRQQGAAVPARCSQLLAEFQHGRLVRGLKSLLYTVEVLPIDPCLFDRLLFDEPPMMAQRPCTRCSEAIAGLRKCRPSGVPSTFDGGCERVLARAANGLHAMGVHT